MKSTTGKRNEIPKEEINSTEKLLHEGIPALKLMEVIEEIILYKRMTLITTVGILSIMAIGMLYLL